MNSTAIDLGTECAPRTTRAAQPSVRELDCRAGDGIEVRLLWNQRTDRVSIAVDDRRLGDSMVFDVEAADALEAFHHPYAYAARRRVITSPHDGPTQKETT